MKFLGFVMVLCAFYSSILFAQEPEIENPFIHEAYITRVSELPILEALPKAPPPNKHEIIPDQISSDAAWIPGYWTWNKEQQTYTWICGIWRLPPPNKKWISGFWQQFDEGWVWIRGFWNEEPEESLTYLQNAPPDQLDENVPSPPGPDFFWNSGYWKFSQETSSYNWVSGTWEKFDHQWILVPAHYIWRLNGYVLIPAYWDWPLDLRGRAYSCLEPEVIIEPIEIVRRVVLYYPDYLCFCGFYYHFYPDYWVDCYCNPPWWSWDTWWTLPWHDQWGCWWWYTHPGYPQPYWMTKEISDKIPPPSPKLIQTFAKVAPPLIVTPKGVVSPNQVISSVDKIYGKGKKSFPIVPLNTKAIDQINKSISIKGKPELILRPTGIKIDPTKINIPKPKIAFDQSIKTIRPLGPVQLPIKPKLPSSFKPIPLFPSEKNKINSAKPERPIRPIRPIQERFDIPKKPTLDHDFVIPEKPLKIPIDTFKPSFPTQIEDHEKTEFDRRPSSHLRNNRDVFEPNVIRRVNSEQGSPSRWEKR